MSQQGPCIYIQELSNEKIFVLVYMDDLPMAVGSRSTLLDIASRIASKVRIRVEEDVTKFLGIVTSRNRELRLIKISNPTMIDELLSKHGLSDSKTCSVPIDPHKYSHVLLRRDEGEFKAVPHVPYEEILGSILHLCNTTRPDVSFGMLTVIKVCEGPKELSLE